MTLKIIPEKREFYCDDCKCLIEDPDDRISITINSKSFSPISMDFCFKCFVKLTKSLPFREAFLYP